MINAIMNIMITILIMIIIMTMIVTITITTTIGDRDAAQDHDGHYHVDGSGGAVLMMAMLVVACIACDTACLSNRLAMCEMSVVRGCGVLIGVCAHHKGQRSIHQTRRTPMPQSTVAAPMQRRACNVLRE